jgi:hypothetical protein
MSVSLNQIINIARIEFFNLLKKSWERKVKKYCYQYDHDDARCDFFKVFSELNLWLLIQLDDFSELLTLSSTKISRYMTFVPEDRIQYLLQHDTINRSSYCTKAMFDTEVLLASLASCLGLNPERKYYKLTNQLLSHLYVTDYEKDYKALNAPAQIRNSLHNNGYAGYDFEACLGGRSYRFIKGQQITFTGWDNLYIFFDALLDALVKIIDNPIIQKISKIPHTSMYYQELS